MGTVGARIGLHEVRTLRWPREPLAGGPPGAPTEVPLPRLPWSTAAIEVPLGPGAARGIERVTRLRKIFGYGVAPVVVLLFVVADVLLLWGRFGDLRPPGWIFAAMGVAGVLLILTGLIPDAVARATGTPYVARNQLRFPAADPAALERLVAMNPNATIERS